MSPEALVALAALGGALIGGLTTVLATHLQNIGAAQRERELRTREAAYSEYEHMKALLSEFLGEWMQLYGLELKAQETDVEHRRKLNVLRARLLIVAPEMWAPVDMMRGSLSDQAAFGYSEALRAYESAARNLLGRINPDTPKKNIEKSSMPPGR